MSESASVAERSGPGGPLVIGILASGRGSNFQSILDAIEAGSLKAKIGVVLSNKKEATVLKRAEQKKIPALYVDPSGFSDRKMYDAKLAEMLLSYQVELVILAGYMRLLTGALIDPYQNRIMNVHPSILPAFPGLHAQRQALLHGVKVSGCTIHFVDEEMDHGPIIAQAAVTVAENDTEASLSERILKEEHRLFPKVIQSYADRSLSLDGRRVHVTRSPETKLEAPPVKRSL